MRPFLKKEHDEKVKKINALRAITKKVLNFFKKPVDKLA